MSLPTAPFLLPLPLDRVTSLALEEGAQVEVHGRVVTAVDGQSFDPMGLFDFPAGGLRVVEHDAARSAYGLAATGKTGEGCSKIGAPSPCLVPRLNVLAHERLRTVHELAATLSGGIELEAVPARDPLPEIVSKLTILGLCIASALVIAWAAVALSRRGTRTALGRVRIAARQALRATRHDATLEPARNHIRALVDRAIELDAVRRACARKVLRIDRAALARREEACARSHVPEAADALACLTAERAEAARLEGEHAASVVALERIESALRIVALRVGGHGPPSQPDPVDALAAELDLRDRAIAEADAP
jgi:hypothetical protein